MMWKIISMGVKNHHHSLGQACMETQTVDPLHSRHRNTEAPRVSKNEAPSFNQDSNTLKCVVSFYMGHPIVGGTNVYYL